MRVRLAYLYDINPMHLVLSEPASASRKFLMLFVSLSQTVSQGPVLQRLTASSQIQFFVVIVNGIGGAST